MPYRSMGVNIAQLVPMDTPEQVDLLTPLADKDKIIKLTKALDRIWRRYGHNSVQRAVVAADPAFAKINPKRGLTIKHSPGALLFRIINYK